MIEWLSVPDQTKINIFSEVALKTGLPAFAVEKDWWVVQTLANIFELEVAQHLVFKGGTSLSKAWGLIDRFSEDVDLAIDREFLGFSGELSKSKRDAMRKAASSYISSTFSKDLENQFNKSGFTDVKIKVVDAKDSDQDPRIIEIYYPNLIPSPGYLQPKVDVEIGCRSLKEPYTEKQFGSLVDEEYADRYFAYKAIIVSAVNPERTYLEKMFLLHEEFQKPKEKARVNRLSRHLYDIEKLANTTFAKVAFQNFDLYKTIVKHRHKFTRIASIDYTKHNPKTLNFIPPKELISAWKKDYNIMLENMIYETSPLSFDELISNLEGLNYKINEMDWGTSPL
jgi:Nucleotidyl transferase AbiEii toxin, Type IV TA system